MQTPRTVPDRPEHSWLKALPEGLQELVVSGIRHQIAHSYVSEAITALVGGYN